MNLADLTDEQLDALAHATERMLVALSPNRVRRAIGSDVISTTCDVLEAVNVEQARRTFAAPGTSRPV